MKIIAPFDVVMEMDEGYAYTVRFSGKVDLEGEAGQTAVEKLEERLNEACFGGGVTEFPKLAERSIMGAGDEQKLTATAKSVDDKTAGEMSDTALEGVEVQIAPLPLEKLEELA